MTKSVKYTLGLLFVVFVCIVAVKPVLAHHHEQVLGEATVASELVFPPVTSGPGYILPDSPLYFLDQFSQLLRVAVAGDVKSRALAHKEIAGERLAELRIMFSRNNQYGIQTSLFGLGSEMSQSARDLSQASARGDNVQILARDLNNAIKEQRKILDELIDQSDGALAFQLKATRSALAEAKVEVEDNLPEDDLWNEMSDMVSTNVLESASDAGSLAKKLQADLDRLNAVASEAATRSLTRRNEALQKAISQKNTELIAAQKKILDTEKKKQDKLLQAQTSSSVEAKKALGQTISAIESLKKAQTAIDTIKKE